MRQRFYAIYLLLTFSVFAAHCAPVFPVVVNVDSVREQDFPTVYYLAENNFEFRSARTITHIRFDYEHFTLVLDSGDLYTISPRSYNISSLDDPHHLSLIFYFIDGTSRSLTVRLVPFPPVAIQFLDSNYHELDVSAGVVHYGGLVTCHAVWDPPVYARALHSVKGHFNVKWIVNGRTVAGSTGWYDTGDRSNNPVYLASYTSAKIYAEVDQQSLITTLAERLLHDASLQHLSLSGKTPGYIEFVVGK